MAGTDKPLLLQDTSGAYSWSTAVDPQGAGFLGWPGMYFKVEKRSGKWLLTSKGGRQYNVVAEYYPRQQGGAVYAIDSVVEPEP